ncbi:DNA topoisomerase 6 subunit A [Morella rubra]|uniref:DNA topoisomerase (ATP-hydrolyzing) n=1 Tax=Morella rubra TaxID=262757 RepID=A0A6A1USP3_9ROSI|nr:DNA topoisomerase 6 subunit A [Morella rubra]
MVFQPRVSHVLLCAKSNHVTKRDLFYTDVKLFQDQTQSDSVLNDISCMLGCTHSSLNVIAAKKGVVVAPYYTFVKDANSTPEIAYYDYIIIDRRTTGCPLVATLSQGAMVLVLERGGSPYDSLNITNMENFSTTLVDTSPRSPVQQFISQDGVFNVRVLVLGGGSILNVGFYTHADIGYLEKVVTCNPPLMEWQSTVRDGLLEVGVLPQSRREMELKLPLLALVDNYPYELKILSVYGYGSKNMSYDSANLTTSDIKWLGIRPSDLDKYKILEQCRLPMTEQDIKTGKDLLEEDFVKKNPGWVEELTLMVKMK